MKAYASKASTRQNVELLRHYGWGFVISPNSCSYQTHDFHYGIDNGAWTAFSRNIPFDERKFINLVRKKGEGADWIVLPDIVAGGLDSLEFSLRYIDLLRKVETKLLLPVQDGMFPKHIRHIVCPEIGIFVGGTSLWKEVSSPMWGQLAKEANCHLHIGRVNSIKRMEIAKAVGAHSFDGSGVSRYAKRIEFLSEALIKLQSEST